MPMIIINSAFLLPLFTSLRSFYLSSASSFLWLPFHALSYSRRSTIQFKHWSLSPPRDSILHHRNLIRNSVVRVADLLNSMGTNAISNEELKEIENLGREDIEEAPVVPDDVSRIAPWPRQITIRGLVASILIGAIYSVIVMKLNLTTGLIPNLNVSVALLGFVFIRAWTKILAKAKIVSTPFTRQENTEKTLDRQE